MSVLRTVAQTLKYWPPKKKNVYFSKRGELEPFRESLEVIYGKRDPPVEGLKYLIFPMQVEKVPQLQEDILHPPCSSAEMGRARVYISQKDVYTPLHFDGILGRGRAGLSML